MPYLVLARKYRPQRFSDVIGQDHVTRTLLNALAQKRIAHGYIFSGHRGIGKTTIARILAMALNCRTPEGTPERPTPEPCGICESCTEIRAGNAVDVLEIDAATNRGIDEIRELRDAARYRPSRDRYKIYILDEAHQITDAAFNALLKTLEEPPDHVIFMMATTQPEDIPQTIRSRCQHFSFHAVSFEQIMGQLETIAQAEGIAADEGALGLLAEAGDGSMRDALSIMDQAIASAPVNASGQPTISAEEVRDLMGSVPSTVFEQVLDAVSANDPRAVLVEVNTLLNAGHSPQELARQMVRYLRNALMVKVGGEPTELLQVSADERKRAARTSLLFSEEDLTRFLQIMLRTFDDLGYRQEQRFHFELGLLKLVHAQRLLPLEQMLSQTSASPARTSAPAQSLPSSTTLRSSPPSTAQPPRPPIAKPLPAPEPPGFSPFEADRRRKDPIANAEVSAPRPAPESPKAISGVSIAPSAISTTITTEGSLALAPEPELAPDLEETPSETAPVTEVVASADPQQAVVAALQEAGQTSAARMVAEATWTRNEREWSIAVAVSEKMLPVAINPQARKIAEQAARAANAHPARLVFTASGSAAKSPANAAPLPTPTGSVHQLAGENPLVQKAKELFQAEIRSVVDLRDKRK
jgi:DNA polymerase-3 subunit gamma/tau